MPLAQKTTDPASRIEALMAHQERRFRQTFIDAVNMIRDANTLERLAALLEQGLFDEALTVVERAGALLGNAYGAALSESARNTAAFLSTSALTAVISFDQVNYRAVRAMQVNNLRLIQQFSGEQRATLRQAMARGIEMGENPLDQARRFKNAVGLTRRQEAAVANYERMLRGSLRDGVPDSTALRRALRDRRFDSSIESAINNRRQLTPKQIDNMVARYRARYINYRAQTIARTEALRSVHEGVMEMYQQAIDAGELDASELKRTWVTHLDERTRSSHAALHGVAKLPGEKWGSLAYPGDHSAPASETVNCRCTITTTLTPKK